MILPSSLKLNRVMLVISSSSSHQNRDISLYMCGCINNASREMLQNLREKLVSSRSTNELRVTSTSPILHGVVSVHATPNALVEGS